MSSPQHGGAEDDKCAADRARRRWLDQLVDPPRSQAGAVGQGRWRQAGLAATVVVGDLRVSSVQEVLEGDAFAQARRRAYGLEESPDNFICQSCKFALER